MEMHENNYGGRATGGLITGIIGTVLGALNGGIGNVLGGGWGGAGCAENTPVNRYELGLQKDLIAKDAEIAYIKGREEAKSDGLELYKYVDGRLRGMEAQISTQAVFNATTNSALGCLQAQVAALNGLTKVVIPQANICPPITTTTT